MSKVKTLLSKVLEICNLCDDRSKCSGCSITVQHEGKDITVNGHTKEIKEVKELIAHSDYMA